VGAALEVLEGVRLRRRKGCGESLAKMGPGRLIVGAIIFGGGGGWFLC